MHTVNDVSDMSLFESHTLGYVCLHMRLLHTFSDYVWMPPQHLPCLVGQWCWNVQSWLHDLSHSQAEKYGLVHTVRICTQFSVKSL